MGAFYLVTQIDTNIVLSFLAFNKKERRTTNDIYVTKWKTHITTAILCELHCTWTWCKIPCLFINKST